MLFQHDFLSCHLWWSLDLQLWTSKTNGPMVDVMWRLRESLNQSLFQILFNLFQILQPLQLVFGDYGFKQRRNSEVSSFHQTSWSMTVTGLSHNAVWRSCIHKDVRDRGGLATWMNVAGGSKISQRSQSIAMNTITAIRTIDSTNCAQIYLDWLGYFMKIGGIK